MTAYLDASVVLRFVLGQPDLLVEWPRIRRAVSSALLGVECQRTLDRLHLAGALDPDALSARRALVFEVLDGIEIVDPGGPVLARASQPFPTALGTLDALHLATALLWRIETGVEPTMATHDEALARAARACGLDVVGA